MNWNQSKSVILSKVCVILFALLLLVIDICAYWLVEYYLSVSNALGGVGDGILLMVVTYGSSIPAWITLWSLWRILDRIWKGEIYVPGNVRDMRRTSWCCMIVALICFVTGFFYGVLFVIAAAAGFMGLIVRIVKNMLEQAVSMKDELDFTI